MESNSEFKSDQKYEPLRSDMARVESNFEDVDQTDALLYESRTNNRLMRKHNSKKDLLLVVAMSASILTNVFLLIVGVRWDMDFDRRCLTSREAYSPGLFAIDPKPVRTQFNGTLNLPSIYSGEPSEEIDAAWSKISDVSFLIFSKEELAATGWDPEEEGLMIPEEYGGGYMVYPEAHHMLHCLNFLRKSTFPEYYNFETLKSQEWIDSPKTVRLHQNHCVELIRQSLMCSADVTIMTHNWVEGFPKPLPNFNTKHKCRNWDSVNDWVHSRVVKNPPSEDLLGFPYVPGQKKFSEPPRPSAFDEK